MRSGALRRVRSFVGLMMTAGASAAWAAPGGAARMLSESPDEIVFEVVCPPPRASTISVDGRSYLSIAVPGAEDGWAPGAPDLPYFSYLVAVPPGSEAIATADPAESPQSTPGRPLPVITQRLIRSPGPPDDRLLPEFESEYREDPILYAGGATYPERRVSAEPASGWRHNRVAAISVFPIRYDAAAERIEYCPRLIVRVRYTTPATPAPRLSAPIDEDRWEAIFREALLNPASARSFRVAPAVRSAQPAFKTSTSGSHAPRATRLPNEGADEIALTIDRTGVYSLTFDALAAAGVGPEGLAWNDLRMCVRDYADDSPEPFIEYPVAFLPRDENGDGLFAEGDRLIFYALDARDFFRRGPGEKRYGRANVYWLISGAGPGPVMESRPSWHDWTGLTPPLAYSKTDHFEEDYWYMQLAAVDDIDGPDPGPAGIRTDHYNWTYYSPLIGSETHPVFAVRFDLPTLQSIQRVDVHLQGQYKPDCGHRPRLWLSRRSTEEIEDVWNTDWPFPGNPYLFNQREDLLVTVPGASIAPTAIGKGANYLKIYLPRDNDEYDNVDGGGVGIDWLEVTYSGSYELTSDRLDAVLTGLSGHQQLHIRRVAGNQESPPADVWVFDLTDSLAPAHLTVTPAQFTFSSSGKRWDLDVQADAGAGSPPLRLFCARESALQVVPANSVRLRGARALVGFSGEDYVAVYPEAFASALEPLFAHRESQGHRLLRVPVHSAYDTYSGGRIHPYAIKRLLRAMWRDSSPKPDYLLLAGDGSNDIAGFALERPERFPHLEQADTNWVPTPTVVGVWGDVVSCDAWYVDDLSGAWLRPMNFLPDLHVGRIPVGTVEEAETYVRKVISYETENLDADWRRRVTLLSDDMFAARSQSIAADYRYRSIEQRFLSLTLNAAAAIRSDSAFAHFDIDSLLMPSIMDTIVALDRCIPDPDEPSRCRCRDEEWPWRADTCYNLGLVQYAPNWQFGTGSLPYEDDGLRPLLLNTLSRGSLVWAYQGHSNRSLLTHEYVFRHSPLSGDDAVFDLTNSDRPFFFLGFGCHLAEFSSHWETRGDGIAEVMLNCCPDQRRGAIAALASIDYEVIGHNYQDKVFAAMCTDPPRVGGEPQAPTTWRLGEIVTQSKSKVAAGDREERITYTLLGDPGLRLGIAPPFVRLTLNGREWVPSPGRDYASGHDRDSLAVQVDIRDETHVRLQELQDFFGFVPAESMRVVADSTDDRVLTVYYDTVVQRRAYDLALTAVDGEGSLRQLSVHVPMDVLFYERMSGERVLISQGAEFNDTASVSVTLRAGAHLSGADVKLIIGGGELPLQNATELHAEGEPFAWTFDFGSVRDVPAGISTIEFHVRQHDGEDLTIATLDVNIGRRALGLAEQPFWMPNPFSGESHLVYELTADAGRARLRIFTATGRCIFADDGLPAGRASRHYRWDGRDDDGDEVANGLYFYELSIWDSKGSLADRVIDKLVRAR